MKTVEVVAEKNPFRGNQITVICIVFKRLILISIYMVGARQPETPSICCMAQQRVARYMDQIHNIKDH